MDCPNRSTSLVALLLLLVTACEDPIDVPSSFESPRIVVDAWLTNLERPQTITLSETVDYFSAGEPPSVTDAQVQVCNINAGQCVAFVHQNDGQYTWTPQPGASLGKIGDTLVLGIARGEERYGSQTTIRRTARIDSISLEAETGNFALDDGIYAQLFAFDLPGRGDTYWVRAYKNDTLLNRPFEQIIAYDATFDAGADIDGTYFLTALRLGINALDDDGFFVPYEPGDRIYVEVHSINLIAFQFLSIAVEQITNEGIFTSPLANAPSNIFQESNQEPVLGIFNVAAVDSLSVIVEED